MYCICKPKIKELWFLKYNDGIFSLSPNINAVVASKTLVSHIKVGMSSYLTNVHLFLETDGLDAA